MFLSADPFVPRPGAPTPWQQQQYLGQTSAGAAPSGGGGGDELDDLTVEELRSLLDNFKNLSKSEQKDLIQYMRKLEATNPAKVQQLKKGPSLVSAGGEGGQRSLSPLSQRSLEGGSNLARPGKGPGSDLGSSSNMSGEGGRGGPARPQQAEASWPRPARGSYEQY